jgi:hypothetical protein
MWNNAGRGAVRTALDRASRATPTISAVAWIVAMPM